MIIFILLAILAEILVWIGVAQFISGWYVFFWFIIAAILGFNMIKSSLGSLKPQALHMGAMVLDGSLGRKIPIAISGLLFLIPGLISDVFAILALLPFTRNALKHAFMSSMAKRQQQMMDKMMGSMGNTQANNPFEDMIRQMQQQSYHTQDDQIIDVEAREITPDRKRINPPKH